MKEKNLLNKILLEAAKLAGQVILFRNNTGMGWQGQIAQQSQTQMVILHPRPLISGLCEGSSDLVGWASVEITPEMVGKTVAVFTVVEGKLQSRGRKQNASDKQKHFLARVQESGGIAVIAENETECITALKTAINELKN